MKLKEASKKKTKDKKWQVYHHYQDDAWIVFRMWLENFSFVWISYLAKILTGK